MSATSFEQHSAFATPTAEDGRRCAYVFVDPVSLAPSSRLSQLRGLAIADACARFQRARGLAVLFSIGFDAFGEDVERAALAAASAPGEWTRRRCEQLREQFDAFGLSCDWERAFVSSDPDHYRWTQWLFLAMREHDLIYRGETDWLMRAVRFADKNERTLRSLSGWRRAAIDSQRSTTERVEGVELQASTFAGGRLTVFTPHAHQVAQARFVAVSPARAEVDAWTSDPKLAAQVAAMRRAAAQGIDASSDRLPLVVTNELATVSGAAGLLPVVVTPLVDARFGPTIVLGIPECDPLDRIIAKRLPPPTGAAWKTAKSPGGPKPATRYRVHDVAVSQPRAWGPPVPLIYCAACGDVPVPPRELPVRLPDYLRLTDDGSNALAEHAGFRACTCPQCGAQAQRATDTIDPRLQRMWTWMAMCVPAERRASAMFGDLECYARWLPAQQLVFSVDAAARTYDRRVFAEIGRELSVLPALEHGEPFAGALMHERIDEPGGEDRVWGLDGEDPVGDDAVRLALVHGASSGRVFIWGEQALRPGERFLERLRSYAQPRLLDWAERSEAGTQPRIDTSEKRRRRLAHWCEVAREKVTDQLERLELQHAAHNVMLLLTRIQDYESRVSEHGEADERDREAIAAALLLLARLLAPLAPHSAEELWSAAASTTSLAEAGWPEPEPR